MRYLNVSGNQRKKLSKLKGILLTLILFSCTAKENMNDRDFPEMIIETGKDTVKVGEIYRAKISLSDTSLLYYYDDFNRIRRRTHPVFRINDELVDSHQDYYIYETVVDSSEIKNFSDGTKFKELSVELAFPHPSGFGDVTLSARMNYIIEN